MEVESSSSCLSESHYVVMTLDELNLQIQYCIGNAMHERALAACAYYEMALAEEIGLKSLSQPSVGVLNAENISLFQDFYTVYMTLFLIVDDLEGARHLWRRAPAELTSDNTGSFSRSWGVGKCLYRQEVAGAYQLLGAASWPSNVEAIIATLQEAIRARALLLLSKAYKKVSVQTISSYGGFNSEERAFETCKEMGWSADPTHAGYISVAPANNGGEVTNAGLQNHVKLMQSLTSYVSGFEKRQLKVEIAKISTNNKDVEE